MSMNLTGEVRDRVGSRASRKLRSAGRLPCSLQSSENAPIAFSLDYAEFEAARRAHESLFDIKLGKESHAAVVRELQWDYLTDELIHCEFQAVVRGVEIETEVSIEFIGTPTQGALNILADHVKISSIPSKIPDHLEIRIGELAPGDQVEAGQLEMPEGCTLVDEPDHIIATVAAAEGVEETEPTDASEESPDAPFEADEDAKGDEETSEE